MKKIILKTSHNVGFEPLEIFEGERIEDKVNRIISNNEPITDGAPIIYTERKDGVLPQYDVRTDKWEIAQDAMDKANKAKIAKGIEITEEKEKSNDKPNDKPKEEVKEETKS